MKLKDLTDSPTDYVDAFCEAEFGHTNWEFVEPDEPREDINRVVVFWKKSEPNTGALNATERSKYYKKEYV